MIGVVKIEINSKYAILEHDFGSDEFLITRFDLFIPILHFFTYKRDEFGEWYRELGFKCPTTFLFYKSEFFWSLNMSILGFGFGLSHQNGY